MKVSFRWSLLAFSDFSSAMMSTARSGSTIQDYSDSESESVLTTPLDGGPSLIFNFRNPFRHRPKPADASAPVSSAQTTFFMAKSARQQVTLPGSQVQVQVQPGDLPPAISPGRKVSAFEIRSLNELIRKRYALDVEIWNKRHCASRDRKILLEKMTQSDATLVKIMNTIRKWDNRDVWESNEDYHRLKTIRKRLEMEGGKRLWKGNPPWEQ